MIGELAARLTSCPPIRSENGFGSRAVAEGDHRSDGRHERRRVREASAGEVEHGGGAGTFVSELRGNGEGVWEMPASGESAGERADVGPAGAGRGGNAAGIRAFGARGASYGAASRDGGGAGAGGNRFEAC